MRGIQRLFAGFLAGMALAMPAYAAEWHSAYQNLTIEACPDTASVRSGRQGDHATTTLICPPFAGFRLRVNFYPNSHEVQIAVPRNKGKPARLVFLSGLGSNIEWRGPKRSSVLVPRAAILRLGAADLADEKAAVLAIFKLSPDRACLMGVVDIATNPEANRLARQEADRLIPAFRCGADKARVLGQLSAFAQAFLER